MQIPILRMRVRPRGPRGGAIGGLRLGQARAVRDRLAFALVVGVWAALAGLGSGIALLLTLVLPRRRHAAIGRRLLRLGARTALGVAQRVGLLDCDLDDLRHLADRPGLVLVANHPSRLDAILLVAWLPELVCVTKPSIRDRPLCGAALRLADYPAGGETSAPVARAVRQLRAGRQLLVFPEGTRSPRDGVGAFRPGFAAAALRAGAPVQTLVIRVGAGFLGRDWPLLRRPRFPVRVQVRLGPCFDPPAPGQARALARAAERAVVSAARVAPAWPAS